MRSVPASLALLAIVTLGGCYLAHGRGDPHDDDGSPGPVADGGSPSVPPRGDGGPRPPGDGGSAPMSPGEGGGPMALDGGGPSPIDAGRPSTPVPPPTTCPTRPAPPPPDEASARLAWARDAIVGTWEGTRRTEWDGTQRVRITFERDGTYRASCDGSCSTFYWGTDDPGPGKRWELDDTQASGDASGLLFVTFPSGASWAGDLTHVRFEEGASRLAFRFWGREGRGPLPFELSRVCAD